MGGNQRAAAIRSSAVQGKAVPHGDASKPPVWTQPKVNWNAHDVFSLVPDYDRLCANLRHLHAMAARLCLPFALLPLRQCSVEDVPNVAFFSAVDDNTDRLLDGTFRPSITQCAREYVENGPVWTADDLNRMERAHAQMYENLTAQQNGRTALRFTLGGGLFGACL